MYKFNIDTEGERGPRDFVRFPVKKRREGEEGRGRWVLGDLVFI